MISGQWQECHIRKKENSKVNLERAWTGVLDRGLSITRSPEKEYWVGYMGKPTREGDGMLRG